MCTYIYIYIWLSPSAFLSSAGRVVGLCWICSEMTYDTAPCVSSQPPGKHVMPIQGCLQIALGVHVSKPLGCFAQVGLSPQAVGTVCEALNRQDAQGVC